MKKSRIRISVTAAAVAVVLAASACSSGSDGKPAAASAKPVAGHYRGAVRPVVGPRHHGRAEPDGPADHGRSERDAQPVVGREVGLGEAVDVQADQREAVDQQARDQAARQAGRQPRPALHDRPGDVRGQDHAQADLGCRRRPAVLVRGALRLGGTAHP
ncbi:hypothetical protein ACU686_02945 [Yinghuangia aomiensis]